MINKRLLVIFFLFLLFKTLVMISHKKEFVIKVLDVGQGDAIYIKTPEGLKILIDGGPDYEVDRYLDKEFFLNQCHLDVLILTHPHQDHIKGLNRMVSRCSIDLVIQFEVDYDLFEYEIWKDGLKGIKDLSAKSGQVIDLDGHTQLVVVWPDPFFNQIDNINNTSVSILLDWGNFEALFLGDLEKKASSKINKDLILKYLDGPLDFYKVPHHGSIDSNNPELYDFLKPEICAVSVGLDNKFKHPSSVTLAALEERGCHVLRTDQEGTIEVLINRR